MPKETTKDRIKSALDRALAIIPQRKSDLRLHPIRVIDSIKSLIGIDLDNVNNDLVKLAESLVENEDIPAQNTARDDALPKEVISFIDFERSLVNGKSSDAKEILDDLSRVADKKHTIEFLIEFSLKQSGDSFLFVWSIYKILMFVGFEDCRWTYLAIDAICLDMLNDYPEPEKIIDFADSVAIKNIKDFDLVSKLYQLSKSEFVRKDRMLFPAKILLNHKVIPDSVIYISKNIITKDQSSMKRKWISRYIKSNIEKLTNDDIICLDSARGIIYSNSDSKLHGAVFSHINNKLSTHD